MNTCTRAERHKCKVKISCSCQFSALFGLTLSVQIEKTSQLAFFLSPILDQSEFSFTSVSTKYFIMAKLYGICC